MKRTKYGLRTGLANYRGSGLTTGCSARFANSARHCHNKTELMDFSTNTWSHGPDFPFGWAVSYSTISTPEAAYIIGGSQTEQIIAKFMNFQWYLEENLKQKRTGPGSILVGNQAVIIGGWRDKAFEDE